jgi:hypothetical protein
MSVIGGPRVPYSFALLRVVPHPYTGAFVDVGVVLQSRPAAFVGLRAITDVERLRGLAPEADVELLARYLRTCEGIARGDDAAGEIAHLSAPERFHWLTAPRSDVIQASPVHSGLTDDPARTLEELFEQHVGLEG